MKRLFAIALAAMMSCSLFVGSVSAVISPELERTVEISKEVAGDGAENYKDVVFNFELDVSKLKFTDNRWEKFAKEEGITYDKERDVLCFSLKAGENIKFELPFGDDYTLSEVGGYDSEDYVSTTINGVESLDHTFDVSKKDKNKQKIEVVNTYGEETVPEEPLPEEPKPEEPKPEKPVSPQTGYAIGILGLTAVAAASGAVAVAAGKKAKKG